jgi:dTDP-4-amino-4,6-dideoxygalactose transaminase
MYYLLLDSPARRTALISALKAAGVHSVFHYVPLHSSPAGRKYARQCGALPNTEVLSERLLRLPLWPGLTEVERIAGIVERFYA